MIVFTAQLDARPVPTADRDWQHRHVGLTVASAADLDAWMTRLRTHHIRHELIDNERLYFADPDGHILELEVAPPTTR